MPAGRVLIEVGFGVRIGEVRESARLLKEDQ